MKKCILLALLFVITISHAQTISAPSFIPQTPQAAAFSRYHEIPVDYSTGVPKINIPLYEIQLGETTIPLSISYHAAGIKVSDVPSEVGLGWVLNVGGNISVQVLGQPDALNLQYPTYRTSAAISSMIQNASSSSSSAYQVAYQLWYDLNKRGESEPGIYDGNIDYYSDRFLYSLCTGENGVFRKDFVSGNIRLIPYTPIKVLQSNGVNIQMKSTNGYTHNFIAANTNYDLFLPSKITSNTNESVQYYYGKTYSIHTQGIVSQMKWNSNNPTVNCSNGICFLSLTGIPSYKTTNQSVYKDVINNLLDSIVSAKESISFTYIKDRKDQSPYRISRIVIKNKSSGKIIKDIEFRQSYFGSNGDNWRLRLDRLVFYSENRQDSVTYKFDYNTGELPPYPKATNSWAMYNDYWGYYNGKIKRFQVPNILSNLNIYNQNPSSSEIGDFTPNVNTIKNALLNQITYPTGGYTEFVYQANADNGLIGGVRIKQIKAYDPVANKIETRTYNYSSLVSKSINYADFVANNTFVNYAYQSSPSTSVTFNSRQGSLSYFSSTGNPNGTDVVFLKVEEIIGDDNSNSGKNVYYYNDSNLKWYQYKNPFVIDLNPANRYSFLSDYGYYIPRLDSMLTYIHNGTNNYKLVSSEHNVYNEMKREAFNVGICMGSKINLLNYSDGLSDEQIFDIHNSPAGQLRDNYTQSLIYGDAIAYTDRTMLTQKTTFVYNNGVKSVSATERYGYDNFLQLSRRVNLLSKGDSLQTSIKHIYDLPFSQTEPYISMLNKNMLTPEIQVVEMENNKIVKTVTTQYSSFPLGSLILPSSQEIKFGTSTDGRFLSFNAYDVKGNLLQATPKNGLPVSYLWNYNGQHLIAEVQNAKEPDIGYANFESVEADGNFTYYGTPTVSDDAPGGKRIYNLANGDLIRLVRSPEKAHILTYWASSASANNISGAAATAIATRGRWTLYRRIVQGSSSFRLSGSVYIDEVRFYPVGSQMKTYTYDPLVGVTSSTDASGRTTVYEYDGFGRLQYVKDQQGNIIENYDYRYRNQ